MAYLFINIFVFVASFISTTAATSCPSPWISAGSSCFYITENGLNYPKAQESCATMGARIATFTEEEFNALKSYMCDYPYWIGLELHGERWIWNDGTPTGSWVDCNWKWGEPDLGELVARVTDGNVQRWAGLFTSFAIRYICKRGIHPTEAVNMTLSTLRPPDHVHRCIYRRTTKHTTKLTTTTSETEPSKPTTDKITPSTTTSGFPTTTTAIRSTTQSTSPVTSSNIPSGLSKPTKSPTTDTLHNVGNLSGNEGNDNLPTWIAMGVITVSGTVALVVGLICCIRARRIQRNNREEQELRNDDIDQFGMDNPMYAATNRISHIHYEANLPQANVCSGICDIKVEERGANDGEQPPPYDSLYHNSPQPSTKPYSSM